MRKRRPPKRSRPKGVQKTLVVDGLNHSGEGRSGDVTVPFALPGEEVLCEVSGRTANILERTVSSPFRKDPLCPHFGRPGDGCGGCTLQHLGAESALDLKKRRLLHAIRPSFPDAEIDRVAVSPPQSRRRGTLAVRQDAFGFRALHGQRLVNLSECVVLEPRILALKKPLMGLARRLQRSFDAHVTLTEVGIDIVLEGVDESALGFAQRELLSAFAEEHDLARLSVAGVSMAERRPPTKTLAGIPITLPPGTFLQATDAGEAALVEEVMTALDASKQVADLFCGIGTFAVPLSKQAKVYAADSQGRAIKALDLAARRWDLPITTEARDLFSRPLQPAELKGMDGVVFDPPRAGAQAQAPLIAAAGPETVVAVSCNPATLARDVAAFSAGYKLERLVLVDQFHWSSHVEAAVILRRR